MAVLVIFWDSIISSGKTSEKEEHTLEERENTESLENVICNYVILITGKINVSYMFFYVYSTKTCFIKHTLIKFESQD